MSPCIHTECARFEVCLIEQFDIALRIVAASPEFPGRVPNPADQCAKNKHRWRYSHNIYQMCESCPARRELPKRFKDLLLNGQIIIPS